MPIFVILRVSLGLIRDGIVLLRDRVEDESMSSGKEHKNSLGNAITDLRPIDKEYNFSYFFRLNCFALLLLYLT